MTRPGLHVVTTVPRSLYSLLENQPRQLSENFDVTLIASPGSELDAVGDREEVRTHAVPMSRSITPWADLRAVWHLYRWFRSERPLIAQSYTPKAGLVAMFAAWMARVPVRIHGIVGMPLMEARGTRRYLLAATERLTYAMATHLTCNSKGLQAWIEMHLAPKRQIDVVGEGSINGVDVEHFRPPNADARRAARRQMGIEPDDVVFIFIGRLVRAKGLEELVAAFDALREQRSDVVLVALGDFEEKLDPLSDVAVNRLTAGAGVIHVSWRDDVRPVLAAADVCVLPSYREGLPNVLLEAAACGLPIVASDINGCNEIVEKGRTGILVPPKDVESLCDGLSVVLDPAVRRAMGHAGRDRVVAKYDHQRFSAELTAYYLDALLNVSLQKDRRDGRVSVT